MVGPYLRLIIVSCIIALSDGAKRTNKAVVITAPKVFLSSTTEQVCIVFVNIQGDGIVEINLYPDQESNVPLSTVTHRVRLGRSICLGFRVPNLPISSGFLEVACDFPEEEYTFTKRTEVYVKHHSALTFIQTDKPIYKPGQTVKFRIFRLDANLKPVVDKISKIWVEDPSGIRIAQWLKVETDDGLIDLALDLSQEPVLGHWTIKVELGSLTESQKFEVKHYVLPKFEVKIISPPFILSHQQSASWKICAHYSYGKPVQGIAEVEGVKPDVGDCKSSSKIYFKGKINGCIDVTGHVRRHLPVHCMSVKIIAKVTEDGTDETITRETEDVLSAQLLILDVSSYTPEYFRPGLPLSGKLLITTPDGVPAPNESIQVTVSAVNANNHRIKPFGILHGISDTRGLLSFTIDAVPHEVVFLNVEAESIKLRSEKRHVPVRFDSFQIERWYSPSRSYIQIDQLYDAVPCHNEQLFTFRVTDSMESLKDLLISYQVISRGNIIYHNNVAPDFQTVEAFYNPNSLIFKYNETLHEVHYEFNITIPILPTMFPLSRLIAFYIRQNGEVVSTSLKFNVQTCFGNQVKLSFSPEEVMPAETTKMRLEALAHSVCGLGVVDKSVHFLRSDNQLALMKIQSELSKLDIKEKTRPLQKSSRICSDHSYNRHRLMQRRSGFRSRFEKRSLFIGHFAYYFDAIEAFDDAGMVVMSDLTLETRPCVTPPPYFLGRSFVSVDSVDSLEYRGMPRMSGIIAPSPLLSPSTDRDIPIKKTKKLPSKSKVEIRNFFPETWLWEMHRIGENGFIEDTRTIPHSITDWVGTAFCTSRLHGIGISAPVTVRAFQPFFLTYTLPYSVKRGETVPIIVSVSNYLQECLPMKLTLEESESFSILSNSTAAKICLCGSEVKTHRFVIRPKALGNVNVTVHAYTTAQDVCAEDNEMPVAKAQARDAISKPLLVKAEGFPKEQTWSSLVCTDSPDDALQQDIDLFLPDVPIVPDSTRAFFSVVGDLMGPSLQGLDRLVRLPVGCGEQNMVLFAPNIFIMQYLNTTDQLTPELKTKLTSHMLTGYQRELTYKHHDGSYSAFGNSDPEGSMWLTAFVIKTYAQAKPFIFIDESQIHQSMQWILSRQLENGCFPFWGRVLHQAMKGGLDQSDKSFAAITAYVLISLLEAGMPSTSKPVESAFFCLKAETSPDVYTLVLSTYAAALAKRDDLALELLTKLRGQAVEKDNMLYWEMPSKKSPALNVEISAYAILCLTTLGQLEQLTEASKVIRWITKQRNSHGGFISTQDTVVALQALAKFASLQLGKKIQLEITIEADEIQHKFHVNEENKLLQQSVALPQVPTVVTLSVLGEGCALVQTVLRYNLEKTEGSDAFDLTVSTNTVGTSSASCKRHKVNICTRYKMDDEESNMVVLEAKMISGFEPDQKAMAQIAGDKSVKLKRWDVDGDTLNMYFDKLTFRQKCFSFFINQAVEVSDVKPSVVTVYDYYQPELFVEVSYSIQEICTNETLPSLSEDELFELELGIIPDIEAIDLPQKIPQKPLPSPPSNQDGDVRVPVDEVIPPPIRADLLGDESRPKDGDMTQLDELMFKDFKDVAQDLDFPDGIEGSEGVTVRPELEFFQALAKSDVRNKCPRCLLSPENFDEFFCLSNFAFTAIIRSTEHSRMKMIHDMNKSLPGPIRKIIPVRYIIPEYCSCYIGKPGDKIMVIGTSDFAIGLNHKEVMDLNLGEGVYIMHVDDKPLEPEFVRDARKKCAGAKI